MEQAEGLAPARAYSVEAFCELYHVGRTYAYAEIKAGRLRARKAGRRTIVLAPDAEAWANALPVRELAEVAA